ncbi:MAG: hypothetical protein LBS11_10505 [Oscillospiraceae bacterium]|nr:hypothetical protein [Oscillospiraceae bacterium]
MDEEGLRLLKSQMVLKSVSAKDLDDAEGWSMSTLYRKLSGESDFTALEMQACAALLGLDASTIGTIFSCINV